MNNVDWLPASLTGPGGLVLLLFAVAVMAFVLLYLQDRQYQQASREWLDLAERFRASTGEVSGVRRNRTGNRVTWVLTPDVGLPPAERATRQHQFNVDAAEAGRLLEGFEYRLDISDPVERWLMFVSDRVPGAGQETFVSAPGTDAEFTGHAFPALVAASHGACAGLARHYARQARLRWFRGRASQS